MNVLIVGGSKGSWQVRGRQLGAAIGARAVARPRQADWAWADVAVLVKRAPWTCWHEATAANVPLIWDVLDFWQQPSGNRRTEADLVREVAQMRRGRLSQLIGATQAMATAIGGVYLPHHSRPGLTPTPIRPRLEVVAYDGSPKYLGSWRDAIETACARLGLTFVINPPDLGQADLLVAFRGEQWDGWACRQWKSGVKYVNAIAAGRPILTQPSAAFDEIQPDGMIISDPWDFEQGLREFASTARREAVLKRSHKRAGEFALERIARRYETIVHSAMRAAA